LIIRPEFKQPFTSDATRRSLGIECRKGWVGKLSALRRIEEQPDANRNN